MTMIKLCAFCSTVLLFEALQKLGEDVTAAQVLKDIMHLAERLQEEKVIVFG